MKSQIKLATVFGVELGLHYSWFIIALLITFSLAAQFHATNAGWGNGTIWAAAILTGILFFACLFAHELSHALVAKARGIPIHKITLFLLGGMAQIEGEPSRPSTEFWMGIIGPITSGVIGLILLAIATAFAWRPGTTPGTPGMAILVWLGYINLALGAFNMIPGFPLDGGRVLRSIIWGITKDARRSTQIAARVGQVVAVLFIAYGVFSFFAGAPIGALWIAFIGWFLLQASSASYLQSQMGTALAGLRVRDLMSEDCPTISPDVPLDAFVQDVLRTGRRCFFVVDQGRFLGLITPTDIKSLEPSVLRQREVKDAMRSAAQVHSVSPEMQAIEALEKMAREDVNQLPVMANNEVKGVVTRGRILQLLRLRQEWPQYDTRGRAA
ncbi:MAG: site-2 protease family protein [Acidobacteriaceae bacterium]